MVVLNGNTDGVEEHENYDKPVEPLSLDGVADPEPKALFCSPETHTGAFVFHPALEVRCSGETYKEFYC